MVAWNNLLNGVGPDYMLQWPKPFCTALLERPVIKVYLLVAMEEGHYNNPANPSSGDIARVIELYPVLMQTPHAATIALRVQPFDLIVYPY